jgi:hypothetical protein
LALKQLEVTIPDHNSFFTLFAEGCHCWKNYDQAKKVTILHYPPGAAVFLYYTYPTHREACVIRNDDAEGGIMLPGLAKKVSCVCRVQASRVDKLKRAVFYLNKHSSAGAYGHNNGFYIRLGCLMEQRGKINYPALRVLFESSLKENQYSLF